ncbi:MAG TPA: EVE domain-containing protein [Bacillales bacterium]|nr:EVE domain-containing protein [Bacillales bacterium]
MARTWFMVASDSAESFRWEPFLMKKDSTFWWLKRLPRNFKAAEEGDLILCYRSGNEKRGLVGLAVVEEAFNDDGIKIKGLRLFPDPIAYSDFRDEKVYRTTEAGRLRNRGTLFSVHDEFVGWVRKELESFGDLESAALL